MKHTTILRLRFVCLHQIAFQIIKSVTKKSAIINGSIQATNVFTMKMEFAKKADLNSAKKQSNEIMVSVV